jgi:hypothetical protein
MTKDVEEKMAENFLSFFLSKVAIYLSLRASMLQEKPQPFTTSKDKMY